MVVGIKRLLVGSYIGVLIAYVGGFLTMPELFFRYTHQGVSYYGNYYPPFIPYAIGLVTAVTCLVFASYFMPDRPRRLNVLKIMLPIIAACIAGILITPEELTPFFFYAHLYIAVALFATASLTALWVFLQPGHQILDWVLLSILITGIVLALVSSTFVGLLGVLPWGQFLAINGAFLLIIRGAWRWLPKSRRKPGGKSG